MNSHQRRKARRSGISRLPAGLGSKEREFITFCEMVTGRPLQPWQIRWIGENYNTAIEAFASGRHRKRRFVLLPSRRRLASMSTGGKPSHAMMRWPDLSPTRSPTEPDAGNDEPRK